MKIYLTLLTSLFLVFQSHARLMRTWTFDTLNDKATLIVIAIPTKAVETPEVVALPNIETVYPDGRHEAVMSKGIETTFKVLTVLKGDRNIKQLVLHHYSLASAPGFGDPMLVSFKPGGNQQFLMFLEKETDGRYVAVSGQTDPQFSVIELGPNLVLVK